MYFFFCPGPATAVPILAKCSICYHPSGVMQYNNSAAFSCILKGECALFRALGVKAHRNLVMPPQEGVCFDFSLLTGYNYASFSIAKFPV